MPAAAAGAAVAAGPLSAAAATNSATEGGAAAAAERQPSALVNQRSTLATHDRSRTLPIISDGDAGQSVLNASPSASSVLFVPGCDDEGPSSCVRRKNRR